MKVSLPILAALLTSLVPALAAADDGADRGTHLSLGARAGYGGAALLSGGSQRLGPVLEADFRATWSLPSSSRLGFRVSGGGYALANETIFPVSVGPVFERSGFWVGPTFGVVGMKDADLLIAPFLFEGGLAAGYRLPIAGPLNLDLGLEAATGLAISRAAATVGLSFDL